MTSKEAKKILNEYRNRNYNSTFRDELELAKAIDTILPKYVDLEARDTPKTIIKETKKHYVDTDDYYEVDYYKCPCCEKIVLYDRFQDITLHTKNNHCQHCGQRLDWSE